MIPNDHLTLLDVYRRMVRIRRFEETVREIYAQGLMPGLAHSYIGEEAVAVGACHALRPDDYVTSTHRGHGHAIAKGARTDRMMAEMLGKQAGYNRGKGGTMHIADFSLGILGANGIVGGSLGIAAGAALSCKLQQLDRVVVCFFGEGAANEGLFLESLNMASLWRLPVVYLCENNQYGEYTHYQAVTAGVRLGARATALDVPETVVDGQDVLAVYRVVAEAVARAREGGGPSFIEAITYRYYGHHVGDQGLSYRTKEEIAKWRERDPLILFRQHLLTEAKVDELALDAVEDEITQEMAAALEFAKQAPFPPVSEVTEHVYA